MCIFVLIGTCIILDISYGFIVGDEIGGLVEQQKSLDVSRLGGVSDGFAGDDSVRLMNWPKRQIYMAFQD